MAITYTKIATASASGTNVLAFTSIPQTYTDLAIKVIARGQSENTTYTNLQFNNSSANVSSLNLNALTASSVNSYSYTTQSLEIAGQQVYLWATGFSTVDYYVANYTSTTANKVIFSESAAAGTIGNTNYLGFTGTLFSSNTAITSIRIFAGSVDTFATNTQAVLYGIKNA